MTRDELILNNQGLVGFIIKKLNLTYSKDDLFSIGVIGLIKAADTWNSEKSKFSNYATVCIRNEILIYLRKQKIQTISLDTPISDNLTLADTISDNFNLTEEIEKEDLLQSIYEKISVLSEIEYKCLSKYYGILGSEKQIQKEIASELNVSQNYVSRVISRAINKLRKEILK